MKKIIFKFANVSLAIVAMIVLSRSGKAEDVQECLNGCGDGLSYCTNTCMDNCAASENTPGFNVYVCNANCVNVCSDNAQECFEACYGGS
jgi:hypothetical protein